MFSSLLLATLLLGLLSIGLGWPVVARLALTATERLLATVAVSLLGLFAVSWAVYIFAWPIESLWILPFLALAGTLLRRRELAETWRHEDVRVVAGAQAVVTLWCLGWLASVTTYAGGGWTADWFEHWERARFFLNHAPLDTQFLERYELTARPPLANVLVASLLALTRPDFAQFQVLSTLLGSLAFLPAALLAVRWGGARAVWILAVLVMANPLFVQNATFSWTKLPAAFFTLGAIHFFLRAGDSPRPPAAAPLSAVCIGAGLLAHYSAAPYLAVLALGWLFRGWCRRRERGGWREPALCGVLVLAVAALWFGWAVAHYGVGGTFLTNTSVTSADVRRGSQPLKIALNVLDTLVPHFLRPIDSTLIAQRSAWGAVHDWFFQNYQVNLPLAFGSVGFIAIARELARLRAQFPRHIVVGWTCFIGGIVLLGVGTHGGRDRWGLAHICLQPLVILGLAFLAARVPHMSRSWRVALLAGGVFDFVWGILLHFGIESFAVERWLAPGRTLQQTYDTLSEPAQMNLAAKVVHALRFFADEAALPFPLIVATLSALLVVVTMRAVCALHADP